MAQFCCNMCGQPGAEPGTFGSKKINLSTNMDVSNVVAMGRKTTSSSAVDKLKKKKKKKRKLKEGKRSSASSASATGSPESDGRTNKLRSTFSCPSTMNQQSTRKMEEDIAEVCQNFNDSLRWLPYIVTYSSALPPTSTNSRLCSPIASKLIGSSSSVSESIEEEEERIAIYKMNRRKRYLAAQQALLNLYPDTGVYAGTPGLDGDSEPALNGRQHGDRRAHFSGNVYKGSLHVDANPSASDTSHSYNANKFELSVKPVASCQESKAQSVL